MCVISCYGAQLRHKKEYIKHISALIMTDFFFRFLLSTKLLDCYIPKTVFCRTRIQIVYIGIIRGWFFFKSERKENDVDATLANW